MTKTYLITLSDEKGRFKTVRRKTRQSLEDYVYSIELAGDYYVESIEDITLEETVNKKPINPLKSR